MLARPKKSKPAGRKSKGFHPRLQSPFWPPKPTRQKNVRQKNEEDQTHSLFFCLTFFCLVAETMIKADAPPSQKPRRGAFSGIASWLLYF
jgi:hypothetical protein